MDSLLSSSSSWMINAVHILAVAPLLLYVGIQRGRGVPDWVYDLLVALGAIIVLYHGYLAYTKMNANRAAAVASESYYNYY